MCFNDLREHKIASTFPNATSASVRLDTFHRSNNRNPDNFFRLDFVFNRCVCVLFVTFGRMKQTAKTKIQSLTHHQTLHFFHDFLQKKNGILHEPKRALTKWLNAVICNQTSISQDRWQFNSRKFPGFFDSSDAWPTLNAWCRARKWQKRTK